MNGTYNPNENRMGNFGKEKNYMGNKDNTENGLSVQEVLAMQNDPTKQNQGKWIQQSQQQYEQKQKEIATEQATFIPDTFKDTHMKKIPPSSNQQQQHKNPQTQP
eukprot:85630_1